MSLRSRCRSGRPGFSSRWAAAFVALAVLFGLTTPASAQGGSETTTSSTASSTTSSTSTSTSSSTSTSTTSPTTSATTSSTTTTAADGTATTATGQTTGTTGTTEDTGPATTPTTTATTDQIDGTSSTPDAEDEDDPLGGEAPADEGPEDVVVPPPDTYSGQLPFKPAEVLWSSVRAAERKLEDARLARREAVTDHRNLRLRRKRLGAERDALNDSVGQTIDELGQAFDRLEHRARLGFQWFGSGSRSSTLLPTEFGDYQELVARQRRSKMIDAVLKVDEAALADLDEVRGRLNSEAAALFDRLELVDDLLQGTEGVVGQRSADLDQAAIEYEAFKAGSEIYVDGIVFPIAWPYSPPTDSFGAPRMTGTPDEHWHEGIDLFAERGTPLLATERGVIAKLGVGRLGGLKFWLVGESGAEWYYAHLDSFAEGLHDGQVVEAGQVLGTVGNTGNAVGTPPHLHMQLHPDGGDPVNPFPLLKVVADLDDARRAAGG